MPRRLRLLSALVLVAACGDVTSPPKGPVPPKGLVVLHAVGAVKGIVTIADTGGPATRIPLANEFDAGGMRVDDDTVLTTSSSFGTNKLYLAAIGSLAAREAEMPANANAGGAVLARGFRGATVAVALRGTREIGLVTFPATGAAAVTRFGDVGRCPNDVARHGASELWVVDYNAACDVDYRSLGDARLIRVPATGTARDTVPLPGVKFAASILVVGDMAYVASIGVTTYAADFTPTFVTPGSITAVDLRARAVVRTLALPTGTSGAGVVRGQDGRLWVTAYVDTRYRTGVFVVDPQTMTFAIAPTATGLALTRATGGAPQCAAAVADQLGRLYCAENQGASLTTRVSVFDLGSGREIRSFATGGTGAVDIALR